MRDRYRQRARIDVPAGGAMSSDAPLIAHVIHRFAIGGMENGLVNLINHMPRDAYRHAIVCLTDADPEFACRLQREDVTIHTLHKRPGKDPVTYWRLWKLFRRLRPAIVHSRNLGTIDVAVPAMLAGVRHRVHGLHGWDAADPQGRSRRVGRLMNLFDRFIERYVAVSQDLADWLSARVRTSRGRITQVYNGVDTTRFHPVVDGRAPLPVADWASDEHVVIGTVGRLDPIKDQARLIDALALLGQQPDTRAARLVIVGDGPERDALRAHAQRLGVDDAVLFTGPRADVASLMQAFDVFALPSQNEGISNTLLEAMASGLPIVATRVGGNPELLTDEVSGRLVPARDTIALARALADYVASPALRRAHGAGGRAAVLERFSLAAMVAGYQSVYQQLHAAAASEPRSDEATAETSHRSSV
jgi:sugar transferase (PEP-CTERM/EpsH1 system associated)